MLGYNREGLNKHWDMVVAYAFGMDIEVFNSYTGKWTKALYPEFTKYSEYRIKSSSRKESLTKPTIPWDNIADEYTWAAKDDDDTVHLFKEKPKSESGVWGNVFTSFCDAFVFKGVDKGTCSWEDSIVERPPKGAEIYTDSLGIFYTNQHKKI